MKLFLIHKLYNVKEIFGCIISNVIKKIISFNKGSNKISNECIEMTYT